MEAENRLWWPRLPFAYEEALKVCGGELDAIEAEIVMGEWLVDAFLWIPSQFVENRICLPIVG